MDFLQAKRQSMVAISQSGGGPPGNAMSALDKSPLDMIPLVLGFNSKQHTKTTRKQQQHAPPHQDFYVP